MNREIKFRVRDINLARWAYSTEVTIEGSGQIVHHHFPAYYPGDAQPPLEIGCGHLLAPQQYTGLKDKNGVEIYEGDIAQAQSHNFVIEYGDVLSEGGYTHPGFLARDPDGDQFEDYHFTWDEFEVIGNIHENPELLK